MSKDDSSLQSYHQFIKFILSSLRDGACLPSGRDLVEMFKFYIQGCLLKCYEVTEEMCFVRGRKIDSMQMIQSIDDLLCPPSEVCKSYGRCNCPGYPVLYAAINRELVFSELNVGRGDLVGLLFMRPKCKIDIVHIGEMDKWRRKFGGVELPDGHKEKECDFYRLYNENGNIKFFLLDAFVRDIFSRPGCDDLYKVTSSYATALFESGQTVSGIRYDSVDHVFGSCVAFKSEIVFQKLTPVGVAIARITSDLGYGLKGYEVMNINGVIDGKNIVWKEP